MSRKYIIVLIIFGLVIFGFRSRSMADCKSDCQDEYYSEVDSCKTVYDDPDDADMLKICIDDAKSSYNACNDGCED